MDDILLSKAEIIERCIGRMHQLYIGHEAQLESNYDKQDAIVLNVLRACEASIDIAMHIVRTHKLGLPKSGADAFELLQKEGVIDQALSISLQKMVGFSNKAVHSYKEMQIPVLRAILDEKYKDLKALAKTAIEKA